MERGEGGASSIEVVSDFVTGLQGRKPTREELSAMQPHLEDLYRKLVRIRALSPAFARVDLGEEVWELLELAGKKRLRNRPAGGLRNAASFL